MTDLTKQSAARAPVSNSAGLASAAAGHSCPDGGASAAHGAGRGVSSKSGFPDQAGEARVVFGLQTEIQLGACGKTGRQRSGGRGGESQVTDNCGEHIDGMRYSSRPTSSVLMAEFDLLPASVRKAIAAAEFDLDSSFILRQMRQGMTVKKVLDGIRDTCRAALANASAERF